MEVTQPNLDIIFRQASLQFQEVVMNTTTWYKDIAMTVPSTGASITYGWLDRIPIMRKWIGNRNINSLATHQRTVINDLFEDTFSLRRQDVEDDQLGIFSNAVRMLAMQAATWPDVQLAAFLRIANTVTGFDGVGVYATNHPTLGGDVTGVNLGTAQSNLATSTALTLDNYIAARTTMMGWVGADGLPLNVVPDCLVVPPQLEGIGKLILEADLITDFSGVTTAPVSNVYKATAKLLVVPQLSDKPNNWWLCDTRQAIKPFLWQLRQPPRYTYLTNPADPNVFLSNQFLYGIDARGAAAETVWFLSYAATAAASY